MAFPFPFDDITDLLDADEKDDKVRVQMRWEHFELLQTQEMAPEEAFRRGMYSFLCDAMLDRLKDERADPETLYETVWSLASQFSSRYGPLRYRFYEQSQSLNARKLAGHARDAHHHGLKNWVVPGLERDIPAYQARIEALRRVLAPKAPENERG